MTSLRLHLRRAAAGRSPPAPAAASQRAIGTGVMGGMIAATVLALLFVPVFFVVVMRILGRDKSGLEPVGEPEIHGPPAPLHPAE